MELRPYQQKAVDDARASLMACNKRIIIHAATGAGKTIIAADIVRSALSKGKRVAFFVHLRELAFQAMERFKSFGIGDECGIIMAGEESQLGRPVQVISIQTYIRRLQLDDIEHNSWFIDADLVIYDEAHSSIAATRKMILDLYAEKEAVILGLTATPCRSDGRGLGAVYQDIVSCSSVAELTELGYLVPVVYYGCKEMPDLKNLPIVAGDYHQGELGNRVDQAKLIGDIYDNWARLAPERQTVIFAVNVKHSKHIRDQFRERGVSIEHVDAHTPSDERRDILNRFGRGDVQVITNVGVYGEGADFPWVSCIIIARPTKSYAKYVQMSGRGLRPYPGKVDCILLDHAGAVNHNGFLDDFTYWTLDDKEVAWKKSEPKEKKEKEPLECEMCRHIFLPKPVCPMCGWKIPDFGKKVLTTDDELERIKGKKKKYTMEEKRQFYGMLEHYRKRKGYSEGWSSHKFKEKFGVWPNKFKGMTPIEPDQPFYSWIKYLNIRWAKSKANPKNKGV